MTLSYRPHFHLTPAQGLLNDPNGLSHFKGLDHVFYQLNPFETDHSYKAWGHVTTADGQTWTRQPIALEPDQWYDKDGVYSGGALVKDEVLYLFYTGNTMDDQGQRVSYQCLATSEDGIHFTKHGPILDQPQGYTGHVRDPKVWYDETVQGYWLILGAQRADETGDCLIYFSKDLMTWDFRGSLVTFDQAPAYMWECPDLIMMGDRAVFIFSPQGLEAQDNHYQNIYNTVYVIGRFDSQAGRFIPDSDRVADWRELDRGFEFYAPQSYQTPDGEFRQYGWMGTMPEAVEAAVPTRAQGWLHHLTLPRALRLWNGDLRQEPSPSIQALTSLQPVELDQWIDQSLDLQGQPHRLVLDDLDGRRDWAWDLDQALRVTYRADGQILTIERTSWLDQKLEKRQVKLKEPLNQMEWWIDTSSLELFVNQGQEVLSSRYFSPSPLTSWTTQTQGVVEGLKVSLQKSPVKSYDFIISS